MKLAYVSLFVVTYFVIQFLATRNAEWLFDGAMMTLWLTSPIWIWVAIASVLHYNELEKMDRIAAVIPALVMAGVWFGARH